MTLPIRKKMVVYAARFWGKCRLTISAGDLVATNDLDFGQNIIVNSPSFLKSAMGFLMTSQSGGAEFYISSKNSFMKVAKGFIYSYWRNF